MADMWWLLLFWSENIAAALLTLVFGMLAARLETPPWAAVFSESRMTRDAETIHRCRDHQQLDIPRLTLSAAVSSRA